MAPRVPRIIEIVPQPGRPQQGRLRCGPLDMPCWLGRGGMIRRKREGDGGTPVGTFRILGGFYRADRIARPRTGIPLRPIRPDDGWCDDPGHRRYNRPVRLPFAASHERMWREDGVYDIVLDLSYNRGAIRPGGGSAIFLHVARPGGAPTEGCVALKRNQVAALLRLIGPRTRIRTRRR